MYKEETRKSLLSSLNIEQVDALIQEERLKKKGYKFIFSIDADDLHSYAYPLGVEGKRLEERNLNFEYITDEQIALFSIFNKKKFKAFLFKEHFEEVVQLINKIKFYHESGHKVINTASLLIQKLSDLTGKSLDSLKNEIELIRNNISLILSIGVGLQADGVEKLYLLRKNRKIFFDEKELISIITDELSENNNIPPENFEGINLPRISEPIYDFFKERLNNDSEDNELMIIKKNVSAYRDSIAIGSVFGLNSKMSFENKKIIFLYISSDFKTQNIFYLKNKDFRDPYYLLKSNSVNIDGNIVNYHRNTAQIFLRLLCEEDHPDKVIANLETVKAIIKIREERESLIKNSEKKYFSDVLQIDQILTSRIEKCRKEYEDYSTFIRIDKFKNLFESLKEKESTSELIQIHRILESIVQEKNNKNKLLEWRYLVDLRLNELSQLHVLKSSIIFTLDRVIRSRLTKDKIQQLSTGDDYVYGIDHHMPTYFVKIKNEIEPSLVDIVKHFNDDPKELQIFIFDLASKLFANIDPSNLDDLILKRCLLLLMLSNSKFFGKQTSDYLENILLKYQFRGSDNASNFYYLLSWVIRRNGKYESALDIALEANKKYPSDPRFYHALALIKYCIFEKNDCKMISDLEESLSYTDMSLEFYRVAKENKKEISQNIVYIQQNIYALLNTKSYLIAVGYSINKKKFSSKSLDLARETLIELKLTDDNYYFKAEFLHTEAFLELQEFFEKQNIEKLNYALKAIELAMELKRMPLPLKLLCIKLKDEIISNLKK